MSINRVEQPKVESEALSDFVRVMQAGAAPASHPSSSGAHVQGGRINLNQDDIKNGLGQLVLTLVKLLHELLERQALRHVVGVVLEVAEVEVLVLPVHVAELGHLILHAA